MKQISLCITIISFTISCFSQQQKWQWAKQTIGQAWEYDMAKSTCIDDENNIYVVGELSSDTCIFDSIIISNYGLNNVFISKFNSAGELLWIRNINAIVSYAYEICLDSYNEVYVAGKVDGYFTFAGNIYYGNWNDDILILKYDSNGNEIWAKVFGNNSGTDIAYGISCDTDNNILLTGRMNSDTLIFSPTCSLISIPNVYNSYIAKLNNTGDVIWATCPIGNTVTWDVITDIENNVITTGILLDSLRFDSITMLYNSSQYDNAYISKYNSLGEFCWVKQISGECRTHCIESDLNNNIYISGRFGSQYLVLDSVTLVKQGLNTSDMFIAKYDKDGNILWARNAGGTTNSGYVDGESLSSDKYGNIYLTGDYYQQMIIDTVFAPIVAGYGIYTIKYNNIGDIIWIENTSANWQNEVFGSALDNDNNLVICGFFIADSISFGEHTLYNYSDGGNIFVAKLHDTIHAPIALQEINIEQGWQMISTYVEPFEPNTDSVFSTNSTLLTIMKDDIGSVYYPQWNINAIGELSEGEGYSINANTNFTLEISGTQILPEFTQLNLNSGWSMIAYLRETPAAVESMLISISSNLILVKNSDGATYWPMYGINYIGNMQPGEGYLIKMNLPTTLNYPSN